MLGEEDVGGGSGVDEADDGEAGPFIIGDLADVDPEAGGHFSAGVDDEEVVGLEIGEHWGRGLPGGLVSGHPGEVSLPLVGVADDGGFGLDEPGVDSLGDSLESDGGEGRAGDLGDGGGDGAEGHGGRKGCGEDGSHCYT